MQAQAEAAVTSRRTRSCSWWTARRGCCPRTRAIAATLRKTRKPLGLVVNKIDRPDKHADRVMDFYRLGFERVSGVSAEHGGGAFDALEELIAELPESPPSD